MHAVSTVFFEQIEIPKKCFCECWREVKLHIVYYWVCFVVAGFFCFLLNWTLDCDPNKNWTLNSSLLTFVFIDMFVVMLNIWMDGWLMNVDCARRRLQYQTSKHTSSSSVFMREGGWRHSGWLPIGGRYNRTLSLKTSYKQWLPQLLVNFVACLASLPPHSTHVLLSYVNAHQLFFVLTWRSVIIWFWFPGCCMWFLLCWILVF